eukprot:2799139-Amphidinium_carterae.3
MCTNPGAQCHPANRHGVPFDMNLGRLSAILPATIHLTLAPNAHAAYGNNVPPRRSCQGNFPSSFGTNMFIIIAATGPATLQNECPSPD